MKSKQKRKVMSRAMQQELKLITKKTKPPRQISHEHAIFDALDNGTEE